MPRNTRSSRKAAAAAAAAAEHRDDDSPDERNGSATAISAVDGGALSNVGWGTPKKKQHPPQPQPPSPEKKRGGSTRSGKKFAVTSSPAAAGAAGMTDGDVPSGMIPSGESGSAGTSGGRSGAAAARSEANVKADAKAKARAGKKKSADDDGGKKKEGADIQAPSAHFSAKKPHAAESEGGGATNSPAADSEDCSSLSTDGMYVGKKHSDDLMGSAISKSVRPEMKRGDCAATGDAIMSSDAKTKTKAKTAKSEKGGNGNDEEASMTPAATDGARYFSGTKDAKGGALLGWTKDGKLVPYEKCVDIESEKGGEEPSRALMTAANGGKVHFEVKADSFGMAETRASILASLSSPDDENEGGTEGTDETMTAGAATAAAAGAKEETTETPAIAKWKGDGSSLNLAADSDVTAKERGGSFGGDVAPPVSTKSPSRPSFLSSNNKAKTKVSIIGSGSGSGRLMASAMAAPSYRTNGPIKQLSQQEEEEELDKEYMWARGPEEWAVKPAGIPKKLDFHPSGVDFGGNPFPTNGRDMPTTVYGKRTGCAKKPTEILKKRMSYSSDEESGGSRPYPGDFISMAATNNGATEEEVAAGNGKAQYLSGTKDATGGALLGGSSGNGGYASEDEESDDYPISPKFVKGGQTDSERRKSRKESKVQAKPAAKSAGGGAAGYLSPTRDATGNTDGGGDHPPVPSATGAGARVHFKVNADPFEGTQKKPPATPSAGIEGGGLRCSGQASARDAAGSGALVPSTSLYNAIREMSLGDALTFLDDHLAAIKIDGEDCAETKKLKELCDTLLEAAVAGDENWINLLPPGDCFDNSAGDAPFEKAAAADGGVDPSRALLTATNGAKPHFGVKADSFGDTEQEPPATPSAGAGDGVPSGPRPDHPDDRMLDEETLELGSTDNSFPAANTGLIGALLSFSTPAAPNAFATPHSTAGGRSHSFRNRTPRSAREIKDISSRHSARKDRLHQKMEQSTQRMNQRYAEHNAAVKKSEEETTQKFEENETLLMQQYIAADAQQDRLTEEELYAARDEV